MKKQLKQFLLKRFMAYFDFLKFKTAIPHRLAIVNMGSSSAKYAFDYGGLINGANWALAPQTLIYDFSVLKNYHSYIKPGGVVLIPLCPFTGCVGASVNKQDEIKYYSFLHPAVIHNFIPEIAQKITMDTQNLVQVAIRFMGLKLFVRTVIVSLLKPHRSVLDKNLMNGRRLERDAAQWITGWMRQFDIQDLTSQEISEKNRQAVNFNSELLTNIVEFCIQRDLKPVIVLPPVTRILSAKVPLIFRELYIYSLLKSNAVSRIPFLNYFDDERFSDPNLFCNSFFLNQRGRFLFTKQVLDDIATIQE